MESASLKHDATSDNFQAISTGLMIRTHARPVLKFIAALLLFLFGLYLLQLSLYLRPVVAEGKEKVSLDPLPPTTNRTDITIAGSSKPDEMLEVRVNGRLIRNLNASQDGRFSGSVPIGRRANTILVQVKPGGDRAYGSASTRVSYRSEPSKLPDITARFEEPSGKNLLLGVIDSGVSVFLEDKDGNPVGRFVTVGDDSGILVWEIPAEIVHNPEHYFVRSSNLGRDSRVTLASLLQNISISTITRLVKIDFKEAALEVVLELRAPSSMPQVQRLMTGEITNGEFIRGIFGRVRPYPDELLDEGEKFLTRSIATGEKDESDVKFVFSIPFIPEERRCIETRT